jgi:hypothetical protein
VFGLSGLLFCELKHEVAREAAAVPADSQIEILREYLVPLGRIGIEHHRLAAANVDAPFDQLDRNNQMAETTIG